MSLRDDAPWLEPERGWKGCYANETVVDSHLRQIRLTLITSVAVKLGSVGASFNFRWLVLIRINLKLNGRGGALFECTDFLRALARRRGRLRLSELHLQT